jgi:hypothetical protein
MYVCMYTCIQLNMVLIQLNVNACQARCIRTSKRAISIAVRILTGDTNHTDPAIVVRPPRPPRHRLQWRNHEQQHLK